MFWSPVFDYLVSLIPWEVWLVGAVALALMIAFKPTRWYTIIGIIAWIGGF